MLPWWNQEGVNVSADELSPEKFGAVFRSFLETMVRSSAPPEGTLQDRIAEHVGTDPATLPVFSEEFDPYEHPNVQIAINDVHEKQENTAELVGIAAQYRHFAELGLAMVASQKVLPGMPPIVEGPVEYVNFHLANHQLLPCVQLGLYFLHDRGTPIVVGIIGPSERMGPRQTLKVEVMSAESDTARGFLHQLRATMLRRNVYRGHVISLSPGSLGMGPQTLVAFHTLPRIDREDVVLPDPLLARIERQTFQFAEHAAELLAAGRSLKRGMLLYGPPGTGKTLTLMYLIGRMPDRTVLLATGLGIGLLQAVVQMARSLAPSMVIIEDVDLIAEERGMPHGRSGPLLFELLNELDGLRDDCDVIFALTTNRPEVLEPALAARPGRIDMAIELPLPDVAHRRRLLELYARQLDRWDADFGEIAQQTDGASPAYIKELVRRAAVLAATSGAGTVVDGNHVSAALEELSDGSQLAQRLVGFHRSGQEPGVADQPTGFPRASSWDRSSHHR
jgi:DNA polymerase III delta prime subunit